TDDTGTASGNLSFYQQDGTAMVVPLGPQTGSLFAYQLSAAGGREFYPGNSARVAAISVIDTSHGNATTEITVHEGVLVRPRLRVSDTTGMFRDDFDVGIQSLDTSVATVEAGGFIKGQHAGFSTLTLTSQNVVTTAAATVVKVDSGGGGFQIQGI